MKSKFSIYGVEFEYSPSTESLTVLGLDDLVGSCGGNEWIRFKTLGEAKAYAKQYYKEMTDLDKARAKGDWALAHRLERAQDRKLFVESLAERS